jgi:hypothetical protein
MYRVMRVIALAAIVSTTAAFGAESVSFTMPFNFECRGKIYPSGQYDVTIDSLRSMLTMSSREYPGKQFVFLTERADVDRASALLNVKFDRVGIFTSCR